MYKFAIALTGSIASGKSTVCSLLKLQGFSIIDADSIAHLVLDREIEGIANIFGEEYINKSVVDRKKLGNLIFNNRDEKKRLEEFLHPKIKKEIEIQSSKLESYRVPYIVDIPLFFETKNYDIKKIAVVYTPNEIIVDRLIKREGMSEKEAKQRLFSQIDIKKKKELATYVIDNSLNLKHLQKEVDKFVELVK